MTYANPDALVETDWLADHLDDPSIRVIDATHFAPAVDRDAEFEHEMRHIPGAVWFDIDNICAECSPLPHMVPPAERFEALCGRLGLRNDQRFIIYDALGGCCASARVWWMFRIFGHDNAAVLNGGLLKWIREKRPMEDGWNKPDATAFGAHFNDSQVRVWRQVKDNIESKVEQLVDARSHDRFHGLVDEVYLCKRHGHIPGSVNLPFTNIMENYKQDYVMKSPDGIRAAFAEAGVDMDAPIITTCGTGVTAAVPLLAMHLIGHDNVAMYDGSWNEWGNRPDLPIEI
ncbi:3-mercaptopyruvate sulfurtransferase [Magnetospira sp. QH-2]|uniref:3-mercaptopyruvate sulfurtransferase n=1 Tax=Magnetospira sp. (strain QH-2) TaxID=1288970 RepID=UPI0003E80E0F|nr:3-mercaptopyruvate sulfurtransferase [Magnetospira sp. QH-2]CCQ73502.1 3-mercaptopyruvate sulfurtransferase [Magnetospira sp. QH-2]